MSVRSLVIVAVDGSSETERTVEYAVSVASAREAELHAVRVVPRNGALWTAPENETKIRPRLKALRPLAESEKVSFQIVTLRGKPESAIPAYAQLAGASLIVVGRNYATSRIWRSIVVTSRLSRLSPVAVIVVPRRIEKTASASPKRVVAAVDFTVASAIALRTAIVMGVSPRTWIDETVSGSTLRGVLRRAKTPVLILPVIAGAHEWIDEVTADDAFRTPSTADAMAGRAA